MTRPRSGAIAGLVLFIVGGGIAVGLLRLWHWPRAPASCESADDVIAPLREEIAHLHEDLARTKARAAVLAVAGAAAQASVSERREPPSAPVVSQAPVAAAADISAEDLLQRTEELFRAEGKDPVWSGPAEILAQRQLSALVMGDGGQMQLECRSTICRAEVTYKNSAQYDRAAAAPSTDSYEWRGGRTTSFPASSVDGKVVVVHYLFKEGEDPQREIYAEEEAKSAGSHLPHGTAPQ